MEKLLVLNLNLGSNKLTEIVLGPTKILNVRKSEDGSDTGSGDIVSTTRTELESEGIYIAAIPRIPDKASFVRKFIFSLRTTTIGRVPNVKSVVKQIAP